MLKKYTIFLFLIFVCMFFCSCDYMHVDEALSQSSTAPIEETEEKYKALKSTDKYIACNGEHVFYVMRKKKRTCLYRSALDGSNKKLVYDIESVDDISNLHVVGDIVFFQLADNIFKVNVNNKAFDIYSDGYIFGTYESKIFYKDSDGKLCFADTENKNKRILFERAGECVGTQGKNMVLDNGNLIYVDMLSGKVKKLTAVSDVKVFWSGGSYKIPGKVSDFVFNDDILYYVVGGYDGTASDFYGSLKRITIDGTNNRTVNSKVFCNHHNLINPYYIFADNDYIYFNSYSKDGEKFGKKYNMNTSQMENLLEGYIGEDRVSMAVPCDGLYYYSKTKDGKVSVYRYQIGKESALGEIIESFDVERKYSYVLQQVRKYDEYLWLCFEKMTYSEEDIFHGEAHGRELYIIN